MDVPMYKFLILSVTMLLVATEAHALKSNNSSGDACTEAFHECLRGCGPKPGSNLACEKYCEEQVLAKCKGSGASVKGKAVAPGAVKGGIKATPKP